MRRLHRTWFYFYTRNVMIIHEDILDRGTSLDEKIRKNNEEIRYYERKVREAELGIKICNFFIYVPPVIAIIYLLLKSDYFTSILETL